VVLEHAEPAGSGDLVEHLLLLGALDPLDELLVVIDKLVDDVLLEDPDVLFGRAVLGVGEHVDVEREDDLVFRVVRGRGDGDVARGDVADLRADDGDLGLL
jgi:hypothetical protein